MSLGISQLRAFLAVVDAGGFGAAAARLRISQSAVSHAVASLERAAGRPVLVRRGGLPRPTLFGEQILEHARAAVAALAAIDQLAAGEDQASGDLTLAAPPTICHAVLPDLLTSWRADFPSVRISLFEGEDNEVASWLAAGTADLAILVDPPAAPDTSPTVIATDAYHALLRADHPLAGEPAVSVAELVDDPFLLSTGGCERHVRKLYRRARLPFAPAHRVRQLSTLFAMVHAGVGVSVVPGLAAAMLGNDLVLVPLLPSVTRTLVLTGSAHRAWHPAVTALVDAAAHYYPAGAAEQQAAS